MGALKGLILDADGSTLYDLYGEFEITPKVVNFALTTASTEVLVKVLEVRRHIRRREGLVLFSDNRTGFTFGGVTFEEYRGQATDSSGTVRKFIADDEAHFFPLGTATTFRTYFAPADFNETANTLGLALYAKQEPRKFGRGTDLHTQSNPLPICHRPEILVRATKA